MKINTFVIDFDDTLAACGIYYFSAMKKFSELAAARTGLDAEFCHQLLDKIDGAMTNLPEAFSRDRFPTSFKATSLALDVIGNVDVDLVAAIQAFKIADSVFHEKYLIYPGVREALSELKARGATLVLNTKGDQHVQRMKIQNNNLETLFHHIYVTPVKDIPYYENMLSKLQLRPENTAFVGDSMRDDIIAPNSLGARTVFVSTKPPSEWKAKWSYEAHIDKPIDPTWWISKFADITTLDFTLPND